MKSQAMITDIKRTISGIRNSNQNLIGGCDYLEKMIDKLVDEVRSESAVDQSTIKGVSMRDG